MNVTSAQKRIILRVIATIESSLEGGYDNVTRLHDGPKDPETGKKIQQVTYGRYQTTEFGNLKALIQRYVVAKGAFADALEIYQRDIGKRPSLSSNEKFVGILRKAGADPIMHVVQEKFFDDFYYKPAQEWATKNGFTEALSMLVIFDSFIQSGQVRQDIRRRFPASPPAMPGGNERAWISQYTKARAGWLSEIGWPQTRYRTDCFLREIARGNWDLSKLPISVNGTLVS